MLTTADLAKHWRLSERTIRARIADGTVPAVRLGGTWRMSWEDVWACEDGRLPRGSLAGRYRTPLATKAELAAVLRVSGRTIERLCVEGLPRRDIPGGARFQRHEAAIWLRGRHGVDIEAALLAAVNGRDAA